MRFFRAFFLIAKVTFGILTVVGLIGGLAADIPGIGTDSDVKGVLHFSSKMLATILYVIGHYPDGVVLCVLCVTAFVGFLMEPVSEKNRKEFEKKRAARLSAPKKSSRRRK